MSQQFPVRVVSRRTGLSPHVLRVWERRYGAVAPQRTPTNRRLYSPEELQRLEHLAFLTRAGHSISQIASLPDTELEGLIQKEQGKVLPYSGESQTQRAAGSQDACSFIDAAFTAVRNLDLDGLEHTFDRGCLALGYSGLIEKVIAPLIQRVGDAWSDGEITAAHEHAASSLIKDHLARSAPPYGDPLGPVIVVGTPAGQLHELGAVLCAAVARKCGYRVAYLGPSLPAAEIAGAAIRNEAVLVALSIVFPPNDPQLPSQLERLRRLLPESVALVAGGRAAPAYQGALDACGIRTFASLETFKEYLTESSAAPVRTPTNPRA